ncbi:MAG: DedA family protein [Candidatus Paceibacterota bacterium]|jgi:membrane-associated protein
MHLLDPEFLVRTLGLIGVLAIVFAESGLFFGFFLPGDSLLFTAGLFASQGYFSIFLLIFGAMAAAILGDNIGYAFGYRVGQTIYTRQDTFLFKKKHVERAKVFYEKYGSKTIVLARFVPIIRTFAPIVAGVGQMSYEKFLRYNILGGALWVTIVAGSGFLLGTVVPNIDQYLLPIIVLIIVISFLPVIYEVIAERMKKKKGDNSQN